MPENFKPTTLGAFVERFSQALKIIETNFYRKIEIIDFFI